MIQAVYDRLAVKKKKTGSPLYIFWDKKCLNFGQDWEKGFLRGLTKSQVIVLLLSTKVYSLFSSLRNFLFMIALF